MFVWMNIFLKFYRSGSFVLFSKKIFDDRMMSQLLSSQKKISIYYIFLSLNFIKGLDLPV